MTKNPLLVMGRDINGIDGLGMSPKREGDKRRDRALHAMALMEPVYWLVVVVTVAAVFMYTLRRKRRARE